MGIIAQQDLCLLPSFFKFCSRGSTTRAPRFERGGCRWESCRERQSGRVGPIGRGVPLRTGRLKVRILHAAPAFAPSFGSAGHLAHVVQGRDGALKTRTVPVQVRSWAPSSRGQTPACGPMKRRSAQDGKVAGASPSRGPILPEPGSGARGFGQAISWLAARPQVRRSERQYHFGMSTGQASRACLLNSARLSWSVWCESTAFRHFVNVSVEQIGAVVCAQRRMRRK